MKHSVSFASKIVPQLGHSFVVGLALGAAAGGTTGLGGAVALGGAAGARAGAAGGIVSILSGGSASGMCSSFFRRFPSRRNRSAPTTARIRMRRSHQYWLRKSAGLCSVIVTVAVSVSVLPEASRTVSVIVYAPTALNVYGADAPNRESGAPPPGGWIDHV